MVFFRLPQGKMFLATIDMVAPVSNEAGSDPRGHLWVTWGLYLCAGKPPLADIILSHPHGLTRCDSVIGLAIPAMSGLISTEAPPAEIYISEYQESTGFFVS